QLDALTRQIILLRRHFGQARDIINFLTHTKKDNLFWFFRQKQGIMLDNDYDDENEAKEQKEGTHC
ncbi:MAG: hypothetical protein ACRD8Z_18210, partial [Nitrososphaeraceae archaeon]